MAITIYKVQTVELSPYESRIEFMYDDQSLQTKVFPNELPLPEVKDLVRDVVNSYDERRAKNNINRISKFFTGDSVEL